MDVDAIVIGPGAEAGTFNVMPGGSFGSVVFENPVNAVSILQNDFQPGEIVTLVQVGDDFGIIRKSTGLRGCVSIPSQMLGAVAHENPGMAACSYIAQRVGHIVKPYAKGIVLEAGPLRLLVRYVDALNAEKSERLCVAPIGGLSASDFSANDEVLINQFEYNQPLVTGWWGGSLGNIVKSILITRGPSNPRESGIITAHQQFDTSFLISATAQPTIYFPSSPPWAALFFTDGYSNPFEPSFGFIDSWMYVDWLPDLMSVQWSAAVELQRRLNGFKLWISLFAIYYSTSEDPKWIYITAQIPNSIGVNTVNIGTIPAFIDGTRHRLRTYGFIYAIKDPE